MSGPPPTPTNLRILRGNPSKRPLPAGEPEPARAPAIPGPPAYLTGYARDEWWSISPELYRLGLLAVIDVAPLAAYCQAYGRWRTAEESLARMAANDHLMSGLIIKSRTGEAVTNPLVGVSRRAANDMVRYANEFGLTPAARTRLAAGPNGEQQQSKFAGLLAGR
jgi:P27 family predicted phage terminase small subunit